MRKSSVGSISSTVEKQAPHSARQAFSALGGIISNGTV
jgi:hypothetical protein